MAVLSALSTVVIVVDYGGFSFDRPVRRAPLSAMSVELYRYGLGPAAYTGYLRIAVLDEWIIGMPDKRNTARSS